MNKNNSGNGNQNSILILLRLNNSGKNWCFFVFCGQNYKKKIMLLDIIIDINNNVYYPKIDLGFNVYQLFVLKHYFSIVR